MGVFSEKPEEKKEEEMKTEQKMTIDEVIFTAKLFSFFPTNKIHHSSKILKASGK